MYWTFKMLAGVPEIFIMPIALKSLELQRSGESPRSAVRSIVSFYWIFTDSRMPDPRVPDPVRDLNNYLQEMPGGSLIKDFQWRTTKEGPEHDTVYHVTAVCKHSFCDGASHLFFKFVQQSGV
jgi:hypothetical protein